MKEKSFEHKIKLYLENSGAWFVKYFANRNTRIGIPDILSCVEGYFLAIEVKAENGRPSHLQKYNVHRIQKAGGFAVILYPKNWNLFVELIKALKTGNLEQAFTLEDDINAELLQSLAN